MMHPSLPSASWRKALPTLLLGLLALIFPGLSHAQINELSTLQANTTTSASQQNPATAMDTSGNFVVVWESVNQDGDGWGIYGQRYNSSGSAQGTEFLVNSTTANDQRFPSVAMAYNGDFCITWMSNEQDGDGWGVYAQRYNSSGVAQGSETLINTSVTAGDQKFPNIGMAGDGRYAITWQNVASKSNTSIYARPYSSSGSANASPIEVDTNYFTGHPAVAVSRSNAKFVVVWQASDGNGSGIYARQYNSSGSAQSSTYQVNTTTSGNQQAPAVAADNDGGILIVWESYNQDGDDYGIYAQRYTDLTTTSGSEYAVNASGTGIQVNPSVAASSTGYFTVAWDDFNLDGSYGGVFYTAYDSLGAQLDALTHQASDNTTDFQQHSGIAMTPSNKSAVIAWMEGQRDDATTEDGDDYGVFVLRAEIGRVLRVAMDSDSVSCFNFADGQAIALATGGYTPYTYSWSNGGSNSTTNVGAGTYTVTVTDNAGATATGSVIVGEPNQLLAPTATDADVTCHGGSDGAASTSPSGGTMPYTYAWSNGGSTAAITGLTADTYAHTLTDANGCQYLDSTVVSDGVTVVASASAASNVTCNGDADGSATVAESGGTSPYTYNWSTGGTTTTIAGLAGGTYSVTLTDANGCTGTDSTTVNEPDVLLANVTDDKHPSCPDIDDGEVSSTPSGGTNPYTYSWSTGATTDALTALADGSYTVTVTDLNGCTATGSATLLDGSAVDSTSLSVVSCGDTLSSIGQYIYVQAVAGADIYQYEISDGMGLFEEAFSLSSYPGSTFFSLSWVSGIELGVTYSIRVRARVSNCWGSYGDVCQVTTPLAIPTTTLTTADCNSTLSALNDYFYINGVSGATNYEYEVSDGAGFIDTVASLSSYASATWFSLAFVDGIDYNTTYNIRVRAKVGGEWGDFGATCQLTTPASDIPQIQAAYCGTTLSSIGQYFYCEAIPGAQRYQYQITDGGSFTAYGFSYWAKPTSTWFSFNLVSGIQPSTTYDVSVRTKIAGVWGTYGPSCSITTPASKAGYQPLFSQAPENGFDVQLFPNPTRGPINLAISGPEAAETATLTVVSFAGQQLLNKTVTVQHGQVISLDGAAQWSAGVYMVKMQCESGISWKRFTVH